MSKEIRSVLITIVFLIFIYLLSFLGTGIDIEIKTFNAFNYLLGLSVVIQILFFIPSFFFKTEKLYDLIGSSTYLIVISYLQHIRYPSIPLASFRVSSIRNFKRRIVSHTAIADL